MRAYRYCVLARSGTLQREWRAWFDVEFISSSRFTSASASLLPTRRHSIRNDSGCNIVSGGIEPADPNPRRLVLSRTDCELAARLEDSLESQVGLGRIQHDVQAVTSR